MPFKDPEKRKQKNREYASAYAAREQKAANVCSAVGCKNTTDGGRKCAHHLEYMREYKKRYRAQPKSEGACSNSDCTDQARPGFRLCDRCNERSKERQRLPSSRASISRRAQVVQEEVLAAYGGTCLCCGETTLEFLSIDHIDGHQEGPRKGLELYRWLLKHGCPSGFRVLCMSCNFTLGHHGYCPHGDLTQVCSTGRRRIHPFNGTSAKRSSYRRGYHEGLKRAACDAYGGAVCACCGEEHLECLQLDHIDDDGAAHRKEDPRSRNLYIWLRQNGYPPGFQVLCVNCNFAKGHFGTCPHQR